MPFEVCTLFKWWRLQYFLLEFVLRAISSSTLLQYLNLYSKTNKYDTNKLVPLLLWECDQNYYGRFASTNSSKKYFLFKYFIQNKLSIVSNCIVQNPLTHYSISLKLSQKIVLNILLPIYHKSTFKRFLLRYNLLRVIWLQRIWKFPRIRPTQEFLLLYENNIIMSWESNALSVNQCIIMNINFVWFGCMSDIFEYLTKKKW